MESLAAPSGTTIYLYGDGTSDSVIYLQAYEGDGHKLWEQCLALGCRDAALAVLVPSSWNDDLTPWPAKAVFKQGSDFGGNAEAHLELLEQEILPAVEDKLGIVPRRRIIAGYSLAGLFACWAALSSNLFTDLVSVSGSLWYPGFAAWVADAAASATQALPDKAYFSLGEREPMTRNHTLAHVLENTRTIKETLAQHGTMTTLEVNPGGHFVEEARRCAKGISWILALT